MTVRPTFRGGKLPAQPARPHLRLSPVLATLPPPPASSDWQDDAIQWPMYANDQVGDCTCAAVGHMVNQLTFYGAGAEVEPPEGDVLAMYSAVTGYVPGDPSTDQGAYCQDVLTYWRKHGLTGHKIVAFAALDVSNLTEIRQAIAMFGTVYVGMTVTDAAENAFDRGQPWDVARRARNLGGHCVPVGAYGNGRLGFVTWGAEAEMTEAYWRKYVDEAWVVLDADGLTRAGAYFTGADSFYALGQQFAALTGEANPIPQPVDPTPTPVPSPPPAPTPATDPRLVQVAALIHEADGLMQAVVHDNGVA